MGGGIGLRQAVGEEVGVGADHTEKIVEGVRDRSNAIGWKGFIVAGIDGQFRLGTLSEMSLTFNFGMGGEERSVEHVSGELIERKAVRGTRLLSLFVQIFYGGIEQREDGNGRVVRTNFLDDTQALEAPGMKINGQGVPAAGCQQAMEISWRLRAMHAQRGVGGFRKRVRNSQPGRILAQEQDLENRVVHRSFLLLLENGYEHVHG